MGQKAERGVNRVVGSVQNQPEVGRKKAKIDKETFQFAGLENSGTTAIPNDFFDKVAPYLNECELRLALYIIRRTLGFRKQSDTISISQFMHGITTRDGVVLDIGTNLSKPSVLRGLEGLVKKGIIQQEKGHIRGGVIETSNYYLCFDGTTDLAYQNICSANEYSDNKLKKVAKKVSAKNVLPMPAETETASNFTLLPNFNKATQPEFLSHPELLPRSNSLTEGGKVAARQVVKILDQQIQSIQNKETQNKDSNITMVGNLALHNAQSQLKPNPNEVAILSQELQSFGLNGLVADKLAANYEPDYIRQKIKLFIRWLQNKGKAARQSTGYLVSAIEKDYQDSESTSAAQPKTFAAATAYLNGGSEIALRQSQPHTPATRYQKHPMNRYSDIAAGNKSLPTEHTDSNKSLPSSSLPKEKKEKKGGNNLLLAEEITDQKIASGNNLLPTENTGSNNLLPPSDNNSNNSNIGSCNDLVAIEPAQTDLSQVLEQTWKSARLAILDAPDLAGLGRALEGATLTCKGKSATGYWELVLGVSHEWQLREIRTSQLQSMRIKIHNYFHERCFLSLAVMPTLAN